MSYDSIRKQIERIVDQAIASGVTADDAYQAVIDAGAAFNEKLAELQDTLDQLTEIHLSWQFNDEELCDE